MSSSPFGDAPYTEPLTKEQEYKLAIETMWGGHRLSNTIFAQVTEITTSVLVRLGMPDKWREITRILFGLSRGLPDDFECNDLKTASRLFSAEWEDGKISQETLKRRASTRINGLDKWQKDHERFVINIKRGSQAHSRDDAGYVILDKFGRKTIEGIPTVYSVAPFLQLLTTIKDEIGSQAKTQSQVFKVVDRQIRVQFGKIPDTRENVRPTNPSYKFHIRDKGTKTGILHLAEDCEKRLGGNGDKYLDDLVTWIRGVQANRIKRGKVKWVDEIT